MLVAGGAQLPGRAGGLLPPTLARCTKTASDSEEELNSLLEELDSLLKELNSLGEVLVADGHLQVPPCSLVILAAAASPASRPMLGVSSLVMPWGLVPHHTGTLHHHRLRL